MTNFEKIKEEIANMNEEELFRWRLYGSPWCKDIRNKNKSKCRGSCLDCAVNWMKENHQEPMPELEDGMFVKCRYNYDNEEGYEDYIGFVFKGTVIFQSGKFSIHAIKENRIIEIYNSTVRCFNQCIDYNIAWRKYND